MNFLRQLSILDPSNIAFPIILIGAGGIGSPTGFEFAKAGFSDLTIFDKDLVEEHNRPNQLYRKKDIGSAKVAAMKEIIGEFVDECRVTAVPEHFYDQPLSGIVVSGVDSMSARQTIWENVKFNLDVPLYIDGRTGKEVVQVYVVRTSEIEDIEVYEEYLTSDEDMAPLACTERSIIYTGFGIASFIVSKAKKWIMGERYYRRLSFDYKSGLLVQQYPTE